MDGTAKAVPLSKANTEILAFAFAQARMTAMGASFSAACEGVPLAKRGYRWLGYAPVWRRVMLSRRPRLSKIWRVASDLLRV
jgi:hypothetical protein